MAERTFAELAGELNSHRTVASQRQSLYERIGSGNVKPGEPGTIGALKEIKIARTRARVADSRMRVEERITNLSTQVQEVAGKALSDALKYQDELSTMELALGEMRRFAAHLPEGALERRQEELSQLRTRPENDPQLKIGLDILEEQNKNEGESKRPRTLEELWESLGGYTAHAPDGPKPPIFPRRRADAPESKEAQALPTIIVDIKGRTISFGEITIKPRKDFDNWPLLMALAKNTDRPQQSSVLEALLDKDQAVGNRIYNLRRSLERFDLPDLIEKSGTDANAFYLMKADVQWVGLFEIDQGTLPELTAFESKLLNELRFATKENSLTSNELTVSFYPGVESYTASKRLQTLFSALREKLKDTNINVKNLTPRGDNSGGKYFLENKEESAGGVDQDAEAYEQKLQAFQQNVLVLEQLAKDDPSLQEEYEVARAHLDSLTETSEGPAIIEIAQAHSNGVRSKEETAVMYAIATSLTGGENLEWEHLHRHIAKYLKENSKEYSNAESIAVIRPGVLGNIFVRALGKMMDENSNSAQKAAWSKVERNVWLQIDQLRRDIGNEKWATLKDQISQKLITSYQVFLPENSNTEPFNNI
ncbi:MAG TPA: hypothetical protein VLE91_01085 [Candidatus Saccharimonadales bacterium]|nr:hypothetical protein [Candidatus Saccharimonadales bacterium]